MCKKRSDRILLILTQTLCIRDRWRDTLCSCQQAAIYTGCPKSLEGKWIRRIPLFIILNYTICFSMIDIGVKFLFVGTNFINSVRSYNFASKHQNQSFFETLHNVSLSITRFHALFVTSILVTSYAIVHMHLSYYISSK